MAKKNSIITFLICIFLLVNICLARSENPDSFSNDEIDTAETNMESDWWFRWYHPWFRACSWPFVHPPMSAGGFCHKFPSHPWFKHPPRVSPSSKSEIATTEVKIATTKAGDKELDWWFRRPWFHLWLHARSWPFVHPPMPACGFCNKFSWHFMHPPRHN
ncbi:hypothetical protein P3L10_011663 [Capsicum annuum]